MKKQTLLIPILVIALFAHAQISQQYVVASIGGFASTPQGSASYTVGEMGMVTTFKADGFMLTQGFLQGPVVASVNPGGLALPVTLLDFSGYYSGGIDHLAWQTASEVNNAGFEVERMNSSGGFDTIGFVKGAGTTEVEQNYTYNDRQPMPGTNYYRLKQVDADGHFAYSEIISINTPSTDVMTVSVYPNPAQNTVNVSFATSEDRTGTLIFTDVIGKIVYQDQITVTSGTTLTKVDISRYEAGQYFVKFATNTGSSVYKLVKE